MQPLSPVDAISPAFSRTRTILYPPGPDPGLVAPFRLGFFLKITLVSALTQGNIYGAVIGIGAEIIAVFVAIAAGASGLAAHRSSSIGGISGGLGSVFVTVAVIAVACAFLLLLLFAWLWCRFRFTLFDLVLYRHGQVARAWSPYRSQAWRFFGLVVLISLALLLLLAVTAGPLLLHLVAAFRHMTPQQINSDPTFVFTTVLPMYGIIFLFIIVAGIAHAIAQDFILPPMALENAPLDAAFSGFFRLLRTRFWYVALYLLFRYLLELGIGMVGGIGLFIVLGVLGGGGFGIGFVLYHALWHSGSGGVAVFILFCIVAGLILIAAYLLMIIALYGFIAVVKQSYALYFFGSYYPPLGDRLGPPTLIPATAMPSAPVPPLQPPPEAPPAI